MEKLQTLAWIVVGFVLFMWRMVQKARDTTAQERRERPRGTSSVPPLPTAAFKEMFEQMQTQNRPASPAAVRPPEITTPAGRPLPREAAPARRNLEKSQPAARSLERASDARSLEAPRREARRAATLPRAGQQGPAPQSEPSSRPSVHTRQEAAPKSIPEMLRNPADVRAAFVLAEILQRRF